jgi:hypothetical protein
MKFLPVERAAGSYNFSDPHNQNVCFFQLCFSPGGSYSKENSLDTMLFVLTCNFDITLYLKSIISLYARKLLQWKYMESKGQTYSLVNLAIYFGETKPIK